MTASQEDDSERTDTAREAIGLIMTAYQILGVSEEDFGKLLQVMADDFKSGTVGAPEKPH